MRSPLKQVWALFSVSERRRAAWTLILVILMALAETASVVSIAPFLSVLARPEVIDENRWLHMAFTASGVSRHDDFIKVLGLTTVVIVIGSSAFKTLTFHIVGRFVHMQRHALSTRLLTTYLHQSYAFFLVRNPSVLSKNVLSEVDQLMFELLQPLAQLVAQGAIVAAMMTLILVYDPLMALGIGCAVSVLYGVIYAFVRKRLARIGAERQTANGQRYQACNEAIGGIKDIKITHSHQEWINSFTRASREFSRHTATSETLSYSPLYLVEAVGFTGLISIALLLLWQSGDIAQVLPALGLYGFAAYRMLPAAQIMYRGLAKLRFSSAALGNIAQDLALLQEDRTHENGSAIEPTSEIVLHQVTYTYPNDPEKPVFRDLNICIPARRVVGIAGKSGAGKSTLMDILLGLIEPERGYLTVDGTRLDSTNREVWQRSIGYVPQHIYLADKSVAENIAFGMPRKSIDMSAVRRAAEAAQIHDFVESELAHGYDTLVGDRGIRLSGGQRQRIGIARALYRDPPVLCMDEATSALDQETELAVSNAIQQLSGKKTIVLIAHRNITLQNCDTVITIGTGEANSAKGNTYHV